MARRTNKNMYEQQKANKYFLYVRRSVEKKDDEEKVPSLESQIAEMKTLAKDEDLKIARTFEETKSAKIPGRPIFNKMMKEIETFGGNILAWNPDRLARNSGNLTLLVQICYYGRYVQIKSSSIRSSNQKVFETNNLWA